VLLSADVRIADVRALGMPGVYTVAALMFVVRPLEIAICTHNSGLSLREKAFLAWLSPRGIVAAAVASLFAAELAARGISRGTDLRALTFLVIACTVLVQGLTGGLVARLLGLRRPVMRGYAIFGANELAQTFGRILRDHGEDVLFLDRDSVAVTQVEQQGFRAVFGNALEERTLQRAQLDERAACLALIPNEEVNLLFCRHVNESFKGPVVYVALPGREAGVTRDMVREAGGRLLFGAPRDTSLWSLRLRRGLATIEAWQLEEKELIPENAGERDLLEIPEDLFLPLLVLRAGKLMPTHDGHALKRGDVVYLALFAEKLAGAQEWLRKRGWRSASKSARPASVALGAAAPGVITDGVVPSLHVDFKHSKIKQYHKEGRALRTETVGNDTYDFDIGRKLHNLPALQEVGFATNTYDLRRLRLHGLVERLPKSHHYKVTDTGLRAAVFLSRAYARLLRPGLAAIAAEAPGPGPLRAAFHRLGLAISALWQDHTRAACSHPDGPAGR
jgi:hypothetical protein